MVKFSDKDNSSLKESTEMALKELNSIISILSKSKISELNELLWLLRADLEMLIVEFKDHYKKEDKTERWKKDFIAKSKGTSTKNKAIEMLNKFKLNASQIKSFTSKTEDYQIKYLWKLKETISSVLLAFPPEKLVFHNGKKQIEDEDIFEI